MTDTHTTSPAAALVELRGIVKVFPGVRANDGVDTALRVDHAPVPSFARHS